MEAKDTKTLSSDKGKQGHTIRKCTGFKMSTTTAVPVFADYTTWYRGYWFVIFCVRFNFVSSSEL